MTQEMTAQQATGQGMTARRMMMARRRMMAQEKMAQETAALRMAHHTVLDPTPAREPSLDLESSLDLDV